MKAILVLAALGAGAWYYLGDPRGWPEAVAELREEIPAQLREAVEAGKRAAARREREVEEELAATLGNVGARGI